jgi:hypothetical protein
MWFQGDEAQDLHPKSGLPLKPGPNSRQILGISADQRLLLPASAKAKPGE